MCFLPFLRIWIQAVACRPNQRGKLAPLFNPSKHKCQSRLHSYICTAHWIRFWRNIFLTSVGVSLLNVATNSESLKGVVFWNPSPALPPSEPCSSSALSYLCHGVLARHLQLVWFAAQKEWFARRVRRLRKVQLRGTGNTETPCTCAGPVPGRSEILIFLKPAVFVDGDGKGNFFSIMKSKPPVHPFRGMKPGPPGHPG